MFLIIINTDCVQMFDSLFHSPPQAKYNSVCSPRSSIHLLRQVKLIGKRGDLSYIGKIIYWKELCYRLLERTLIVLDRHQCVHDPQWSTSWKKIVFSMIRFLAKTLWILPGILTFTPAWQAFRKCYCSYLVENGAFVSFCFKSSQNVLKSMFPALCD